MKALTNSLIFLLIFVSSHIAILFPSITINGFKWPPGIGLILCFGLTYLVTAGYSNVYGKRFSGNTITIAILLGFVVFAMLDVGTSKIRYAAKMSPLYLTWILGFVGGMLHSRNGFEVKKAILLALFPVVMAFNLFDLWIHKVDYGNFTGAVATPKVVAFEFANKEKQVVSNEDLQGKVVWLDFWFVGCPPCWKVFPDVQRIHDELKDNQSFALYAVNAVDDPEILFPRIEERGYTFPVATATQKEIDALGVVAYPTVILLNKEGAVIFKGEHDEAELMLDDLLNE